MNPHIGPLTKVILLKLFLDIKLYPVPLRRLLSRCVDSRSKREEMAGTSFYMFRFRFRTEMFSELSAVFLFGQAFVCFVLIWLCSLCGFRKFNEANF